MMQIRRWLDRGLLGITSTLMVLMVLGVVWQVFSRYVLNAPSTFMEELMRICLIWIAMLGAGYAFGTNQHLSFSFFQEKMTDKNRKRLQLINMVLIVGFALVVLIKGGIDLFFVTLDETTAILLLPRGVVNVALPISGLIILVYQVFHVVDLYRSSSQ
ncbi:TRAP transporter small permease [Desmospora activa]|uniref:TRAP-type C4-dicarboxylate transport system permease small subunit n=1 Tax=Desmospora activa DSM 45169 TaxID=1121389 RepID=A0A2T4ZCG3_9BACL|nr:TRAP transporter small permease [Desmospora activa]PTM59559.1 TRAP-type C4-dicarboxylate transport system permease small subunit [Desmospora activa DSM 45169]